MGGLVSLLLFAAFFYFMMRWGCGAHMAGGHGGHGGSAGGHQGHQSHGQTASASVIDPICGMVVDPAEGYARVYEGQEYRFCSRKCLDRFDADPARHAGAAGGAA